VLGKPEALVSRFSDQEPLSLICRILATAGASKADGLSQPDLVDFVQSTFAAHQRGVAFSPQLIANTLGRLLDATLVERMEDRYRLTGLGKVAGELGIQVESVVRVARALKGLDTNELTDTVLLAAAQATAELDDVIFPVHKTSVKERQRWQGAIQQQWLPSLVQQELSATDDASYTARCKRLSAVLMWLEGVELNKLEASLLIHLPGENAAGPIRAAVDRTRDLIGVVARIGSLVSRNASGPTGEIDDLVTRLELGIPQDVLWLAREAKRGLERGDYLALRRTGLNSVEALDESDDAALAEVVNSESKRRRIRKAVDVVKALARARTAKDELPMPTPPQIH